MADELDGFDALVGEWATEATHPAMPDVEVAGWSTFEWLEGQRFLINRARNEHPDFPDSISVIGEIEDRLAMYYFDSRGVHRIYQIAFEDWVWRIWRDEPGFEQRIELRLSDGGDVMSGTWELARGPSDWNPDLAITYRRES